MKPPERARATGQRQTASTAQARNAWMSARTTAVGASSTWFDRAIRGGGKADGFSKSEHFRSGRCVLARAITTRRIGTGSTWRLYQHHHRVTAVQAVLRKRSGCRIGSVARLLPGESRPVVAWRSASTVRRSTCPGAAWFIDVFRWRRIFADSWCARARPRGYCNFRCWAGLVATSSRPGPVLIYYFGDGGDLRVRPRHRELRHLPVLGNHRRQISSMRRSGCDERHGGQSCVGTKKIYLPRELFLSQPSSSPLSTSCLSWRFFWPCACSSAGLRLWRSSRGDRSGADRDRLRPRGGSVLQRTERPVQGRAELFVDLIEGFRRGPPLWCIRGVLVADALRGYEWGLSSTWQPHRPSPSSCSTAGSGRDR